MSKIEQLQKLRAEIAGDAQLVEKLRAFKSPNEIADQVARIAQERGYDVTVGDILAVITGEAAGTELTEEELQAVSGAGNEPWRDSSPTPTIPPTPGGCRDPLSYPSDPKGCWYP